MLEEMREILHDSLPLTGVFKVDFFRKYKSGYRKIWTQPWKKNGITVEGKNHLLNEVFPHSAYTPAPVDPWYIGAVSQTPTPSFNESDTLALHPGWTEFTTLTGNRQAWDPAAASNKIKGSATVTQLTASAGGEVNGMLVASVASGTAGILWSTGSFDSSIVVVATDVWNVTYGLRL